MILSYFGVDFDLSSQVHSGLCTKKLSQKMPKITKSSKTDNKPKSLIYRTPLISILPLSSYSRLPLSE